MAKVYNDENEVIGYFTGCFVEHSRHRLYWVDDGGEVMAPSQLVGSSKVIWTLIGRYANGVATTDSGDLLFGLCPQGIRCAASANAGSNDLIG